MMTEHGIQTAIASIEEKLDAGMNKEAERQCNLLLRSGVVPRRYMNTVSSLGIMARQRMVAQNDQK